VFTFQTSAYLGEERPYLALEDLRAG